MTTSRWQWPVYVAYQREEWALWWRALLALLPAAVVLLVIGLVLGEHPITWVPVSAFLLLAGGGALHDLLLTRRFGVARAFMAQNGADLRTARRRLGLTDRSRPAAMDRRLADHAGDPPSHDRAYLLLALGRFEQARNETARLPDDGPWERYGKRRLDYLAKVGDRSVDVEDLAPVRESIAGLEDRRARAFAVRDLVLLQACADIVSGPDWVARMRRSAEAANAQLRSIGLPPVRDRPFLMVALTITVLAFGGLAIAVLVGGVR